MNDESLILFSRIFSKKNKDFFHLKNFIDNLPMDVYLKRFDGNNFFYLGMNQAGGKTVCKMGFKWKLEDIIGKTDYELFNRKTAEALRQNDLEIIARGVTQTKEEVFFLPSGKELIGASTKGPLLNTYGDTIGIIGSSVDITARKQAERSHEELITSLGRGLDRSLTNVIPLNPNGSLTHREIQCLFLAAQGKTNKKIASKMQISIHTINMHKRNIFRKLNCNNMNQSIAKAIYSGLLDKKNY